MIIRFDVAGEPAEFRRNWFTGRTELHIGGNVVLLESALNLSTQFSTKLTKVLKCRVGDHEISIEQTRPLLFVGARRHDYRVAIDGLIVTEQRGF